MAGKNYIVERLRDLRGGLCYLICFHTPLDRMTWNGFIYLLQFAGDWIYRETRWCPGRGKTARDCIAAGTCGCDNAHRLLDSIEHSAMPGVRG